MKWTGTAGVLHSDVLDALSEMPDGRFDAVIVDAPYGLSVTKNDRGSRHWDSSAIAFSEKLWSEIRRVSAHGAVLAAFGHPRTSHRQTVAIEDAGWRIIDTLAWVKAHGFQAGNRDLEKELTRISRPDLSEGLSGWGTHLKPAFEPITLARNLDPRESIVNVLAETGAGGLNLGATAIPSGPENLARAAGRVSDRAAWAIRGRPDPSVPRMQGRMPGNVLLEHHGECSDHTCVDRCPVASIDAQARAKYAAGRELPSRGFTRLRYSARAPESERPLLDGIVAPTVKPQQVLGWLCDLIVRPGMTVLDPFGGSGAVAEALLRAGANSVSIERDAGYVSLIHQRLGLDDKD